MLIRMLPTVALLPCGGGARHVARRVSACGSSPSLLLRSRLRSISTTRIHRQQTDAPSPPNINPARLAPVEPVLHGKPYYVTTPIFYVNARPHIGHLQSMVLADVLARWYQWRHRGWAPPRIVGNDEDAPSYDEPIASFATHDRGSLEYHKPDDLTRVVFATGTDEHGGKIQKEAEKLGTTPRALCDRVSESFKQLADAAGVEYTRFIRTTDVDHVHTATSLWTRLMDEGFIYKGKHSGWYSTSDEAFYPETQVCASPDDPNQMISSETGSAVEWTEEENYKFRLSLFEQPLRKWLKANPAQIVPQTRYMDTLKELDDGLNDLSVSRPSSRLQWGIGVPGDADQTMYVWFDALLNYVTVSGYPWTRTKTDNAAATKQWPPSSLGSWPADAQLVGKDIVRFHAIYFPAFLMALGLPLPRQLITHGHWKVNASKMSKSRGNSVDPFAAMQLVGRDELRFYLTRIGGNLARDAEWKNETVLEFRRKYIQSLWGNMLARVLTPKLWARLIPRAADSVTLPNPIELDIERTDEQRSEDVRLRDMTVALCSQVDRHMARSELDLAMRAITELLEQCHRHWSVTETFRQPNGSSSSSSNVNINVPLHIKEGHLWTGMFLTMEALRIVALVTQAVMPDKTAELLDALGIPSAERTFLHAQQYRATITMQRPAKKPAQLFPPLESNVQPVVKR